MYKVIYLTGTPASGKTSLLMAMKREMPRLITFSYGEELLRLVQEREQRDMQQDEIREKSSRLITKEDVMLTDEKMINLISKNRASNNILIDSHPVTKEEFGFRITAFNIEQLKKLNPDILVCLYADSEVIRERIKKNSEGRPLISEFEANMHNSLQSSVVANYGILLGLPVYYLNSGIPPNELIYRFIKLLNA